MHRLILEAPGTVGLAFDATAPLESTGRFFAVLETELGHRAARRVLVRFDGLDAVALAPVWKSFEFSSGATDAVERAAIVGPVPAHTWLERLGRMMFAEAEILVSDDETRARAHLGAPPA